MMYVAAFTVLLVLYLVSNKRYRWFYIIYKTLGRDIRLLRKGLLLNINVRLQEHNKQTVPKMFKKLASKHPNKVAFYFEDEVWTFEDVEKFSNRIANFFKKQNYKRGDTVALFLEARPEYVCIWLGLAKIGVVTALINTNLVADSLVRSIEAAGSKGVIYGSASRKTIEDISGKLANVKLFGLFDETDKKEVEGVTDLTTGLEFCSDACPIEELEKGRTADKLMYIYTSGTTGLPKAAVITHRRFMFIVFGAYSLTNLNQKDTLYDSLPLYHSMGGVMGIGQCLLKGCSVVIKKKFSASNFWNDCIKYQCTVAMYIGEVCRYLLVAHSKNNKPITHSVKKFIGAGLRPQIWNHFVSKFKIQHVYEIYGSTEGNANLMNIDNTPGAVGFYPPLASFLHPLALVKCDEATGLPIRGSDGFCKFCQPGEPGVVIGKVAKADALSDFAGYADKKASEEKLIRNVFKNGDVYFNSGDMLVQDELGYFYFKDRTGDTFRWKGENVSTTEVEAVISTVLNYDDAVVYGVEVPGTEGRAGMVAIVDSTKTLDIESLGKTLKDNLPSYAVPIFVRLMQSVPLTGTFKLKKRDLQQEGFDVGKIKDKLFLYDAKKVTYVELTEEKFNDIVEGKIHI